MVALHPPSTKAALRVSESEEVLPAVKLSNPRKDNPRFEIPGRGPIVAASGVVALFVLASLLSVPPKRPALPPTPHIPRSTPTPEPTSADDPTPSQPPEPEPECDIKGNISTSGERIYHLPGQFNYESTVISPQKGERWFCSEEEAVAARWRKAKR